MNDILSLKEMLKLGERLGWEDIDIVTKYLTQDNIDVDAIKVISNVLSNKMEKLELQLAFIKSNMSFDTSYYYKAYKTEDAQHFDKMTRYMMLNLPFDDEDIEYIKASKTKIKNGPFWHDLAEVIDAIRDISYSPKFCSNYYTHWDDIKAKLLENAIEEVNKDAGND